VRTAYRGLIARDITQARFDWMETLYLPLGTHAGEVDYILNVSAYGIPPSESSWRVMPA